MSEYTKIILLRILTALTLAGVLIGVAVLISAARDINARKPSHTAVTVGDDEDVSAEYRDKVDYLINDATQAEFSSEIFKYIDKDSVLSWMRDVMIALHYQSDDKLYSARTRLFVHGREHMLSGSGVFIQTSNPLIKKLSADRPFMSDFLRFVYDTVTDSQKKQDILLHYDTYFDQRLLTTAPGEDYKKIIKQNIGVIQDFFDAPRLEYTAIAEGEGLSKIILTMAHLAPLQLKDVTIEFSKAIEPIRIIMSQNGSVVCQNSIEKEQKMDTLVLECSLPVDEPVISQFIPAYTTAPFLYSMIKFEETEHTLELSSSRNIKMSDVKAVKFNIESIYSGRKMKNIADVVVDQSRLYRDKQL